jgi:anhydro-N-acetylmuramic acid kinase
MLRTPSDIITSILVKEHRIVCGLMSGTSVDGINAALVEISGNGESTRINVLGFSETSFSEEVQAMILSNAEASTSTVTDICLLHTLLAQLYADVIQDLCAETGIDKGSIDLIGMHGQTIRHVPDAMRIAGYDVRGTLQIGSGTTLATLLGIPVISDFRAADMIVGGQGAPLVPYVEYLLFRSTSEHRLLVNIGGIANITWLPRGCCDDDVRACDTGPGNMVIDALMRRFYGKEFDESGAIACSGNVNTDLLAWCLSHSYFTKTHPKSTGREEFGAAFVENLVQFAGEFGVTETADLIATASECTVRSLAKEILSFVPSNEQFILILSGGGAKNRFLRDGLRYSLPNAILGSLDAYGVRSEAKEAVCFAVLANEWLHGNPANLPSVTGAHRRVALGSFAI